MKEKLQKLARRAAVAGGALVLSGAAMAADDPGLDAINALATRAGVYIAAATSAVVVIAGGFWALRMMKKAFSKAG